MRRWNVYSPYMRDTFEARDVSMTRSVHEIWTHVVDDSLDAWVWHSWNMLELTMCASPSLHPVNLSFFVYERDQVIGLVPLLVRDCVVGEGSGKIASYHPGIGFLPSPACIASVAREPFEDFAFEELERRARGAGATQIRMRFTPAKNHGDDQERVERIAKKFSYTVKHMESHIVSLESGPPKVRDRFERYYKKFSPLFDVHIVEGAEVTADFADQYRQLHEKDAGRVVRSPESYQKQADTARLGLGFYVVAAHKESQQMVGALLILLYKQVAYDGSVAVDPLYAEFRVGHILKWVAIEELLRRRVSMYELGQRADPASANEKELGISNFKEGWSRGNTRSVWQLEKTLSVEDSK